jgi:hypothetical protein
MLVFFFTVFETTPTAKLYSLRIDPGTKEYNGLSLPDITGIPKKGRGSVRPVPDFCHLICNLFNVGTGNHGQYKVISSFGFRSRAGSGQHQFCDALHNFLPDCFFDL